MVGAHAAAAIVSVKTRDFHVRMADSVPGVVCTGKPCNWPLRVQYPCHTMTGVMGCTVACLRPGGTAAWGGRGQAPARATSETPGSVTEPSGAVYGAAAAVMWAATSPLCSSVSSPYVVLKLGEQLALSETMSCAVA